MNTIEPKKPSLFWFYMTLFVGAFVVLPLVSTISVVYVRIYLEGERASHAWVDQDTGCEYIVTPQGGITARLRSDATPMCTGTVIRKEKQDRYL